MPFKSVFNPGKGECTSVLKWKGITMEEFTLVYSNIFQKSFYNTSLVTFWTHLVNSSVKNYCNFNIFDDAQLKLCIFCIPHILAYKPSFKLKKKVTKLRDRRICT